MSYHLPKNIWPHRRMVTTIRQQSFFEWGPFVLGDGKGTRFWEDTWLGETPLSSQYLALYNIVRHKHVRVADVLSNPPLNTGFRRVLRDDRWESWLNLVQRLMTVQQNDEPDCFKWHLTTSGVFSMKSLYADFMNDHTKYLQKYLWKMKVPLKISIFMCFLHKKVILIKDNLLKRSWSPSVHFEIVRKWWNIYLLLHVC
jgi:hypothetical protein